MIQTIYYRPSEPENKIVGDFVSTGVFGRPEAIRDYCTMAVLDGKRLIAGTIYHNWQEDEGVIELTSFSLSKKWLTKPVVRAMMSLPFDRLGCQLIVLRVSERNTSMCAIARKFGFTEVHIPRLFGRYEGAFIFSLTDDQWKTSRYNALAAG